jgi:hypothetical protein
VRSNNKRPIKWSSGVSRRPSIFWPCCTMCWGGTYKFFRAAVGQADDPFGPWTALIVVTASSSSSSSSRFCPNGRSLDHFSSSAGCDRLLDNTITRSIELDDARVRCPLLDAIVRIVRRHSTSRSILVRRSFHPWEKVGGKRSSAWWNSPHGDNPHEKRLDAMVDYCPQSFVAVGGRRGNLVAHQHFTK